MSYSPQNVQTATSAEEQRTRSPAMRTSDFVIYLLMGIFFGIVLIKSEVVSWFRIQEMFRFQAFHMYGIIGSAIVVAGLSVELMRQLHVTTIHGESIQIEPKSFETGKSQIIGGIAFGLGWGLLGACPGPIYALFGSGYTVVGVALLSAAIGAWTYGQLKPRLPH